MRTSALERSVIGFGAVLFQCRAAAGIAGSRSFARW